MRGIFDTAPLPIEEFLPETAVLYAALYAAADDPAVDRAAALAALEKKCLLFDTTWATENGGFREKTTGTAGLTSVATGDGTTKHPASTGYQEAVTDVVITVAHAWEDATVNPRTVIPVVEYQGKPVPYMDIKYCGDGKSTGEMVICVDNTGNKYGATDPVDADWRVTFIGYLIGLMEADLAGISLPVTTTKQKVCGVGEAVITRNTQDGAEGTGSFKVMHAKGRVYVAKGAGGAAAEILNSPGEDLMKALYGSNWTAGSENAVGYLPSGYSLVLCLLLLNPEFPLLHPVAAADNGKVFAVAHLMYGCEVTDLANLPGVTATGTDPIGQQVSVKWREKRSHTFLTSGGA